MITYNVLCVPQNATLVVEAIEGTEPWFFQCFLRGLALFGNLLPSCAPLN